MNQTDPLQKVEKKSPRAKFLSILAGVLGLIIMILIIIGGSVLASKKWDPKWDPFTQKEISKPGISGERAN